MRSTSSVVGVVLMTVLTLAPLALRAGAQTAAPGDGPEGLAAVVAPSIGLQDDAPAVLTAGPMAAEAEGNATTQPEDEDIAPPADGSPKDWFDRAKNPVTWLKWGADLRLRWEYANNAHGLNKDLPNHERSYYRQRARLWSTVSPVPDIEINTRLAWEFRAYFQPAVVNSSTGRGYRDVDLEDVIFDNLNVKFKNVLRQPKGGDSLDVTVGRQDITFGDGWLVYEGTPLDASRTIFFDAARATYNARSIKTTADLVYIEQHADPDWFIEPFNHRECPLSNQDERGAILYLSNKSIKDTTIDGYFIYKHDELASGVHSTAPRLASLKRGNESDIYTFGGRVKHAFSKHLESRAELAGQFGNKNRSSLGAWGFNSRTAYFFRDKLDNQLRFDYEFLTGDDPSTEKIEAFDPLWGRYTRFDEIQANLISLENGRASELTNMHRFGPGWSFKPAKPLEFCIDYNFLFADENTVGGSPGFSNNGRFRGQMLQTVLKYKFNDHISAALLGEVFFPGNYYDDYRNDVATFLKTELMFSF